MNNIFLIGLILSVSLCQQRTVIDKLQGTQVVEEGNNIQFHYFEDENTKEKYEQMMNHFLNLNQMQLLTCKKSDSHEFFGMSFQNVGRINNLIKNIKFKSFDKQIRIQCCYL